MSDSILSKELIEAFRPIAEMNNEQFRHSTTMLAGFIATDERDIDYMDRYMDPIFDFVNPESETEMLMRNYYAHISTFNPEEAAKRFKQLENYMGYYSKAVLAAGLTAKKLHFGQKDKGGNDYFESHLLKVAAHGFDWKEKIVGFLHDATEDTPVTAEDVLSLLDTELENISQKEESEWWEEWMEEFLPYPAPSTFFIGPDDRVELLTALNLLNHHSASTREEYIENLSKDHLALQVKLNDLKNNMDLSRIPHPTEKDFQRLDRYQKEYDFLLNTLHQQCSSLFPDLA